MPKIELVLPSKKKEDVREDIVKLLEAATAVGLTLEPQAFTMAWLSDHTRVFVATEDGKTTGFAIMAFGRRYYDAEQSASVLVAEGEARNDLLKFMFDAARVLGAKMFYYESTVDDVLGGEPTPLKFVEIG